MDQIIDFHVHIFPEKIARKATQSISDFYGVPMCHLGTWDILTGEDVGARFSAYAVHAVATDPGQVKGVNDFLLAQLALHPGVLYGFGSLHPDMADWQSEYTRLMAGGCSGLKFHPDFQRFSIDDRRMYGVYERAEGHIPIMFHTGDSRYDYSSPERLDRVLRDFPRLLVIAAHFGGYSQWESAKRLLTRHENCFVDCSSSFAFLGAEKSLETIRAFSAQRILFGSDFPMWNPQKELAFLRSLPLREKELSLITFENAKRILKI